LAPPSGSASGSPAAQSASRGGWAPRRSPPWRPTPGPRRPRSSITRASTPCSAPTWTPKDEKLALLINAYNAFTLRLVLDHRPVASIEDIPSGKRWDDRRWTLAGETLSLSQIEHERIRPRFREPRVHFALVCAARSCPPLRAEAYVGDRLEGQLADQTRRVHSGERWLRFDPASGRLDLTRLYDWYGSDFLQAAPSVEEYVAAYAPAVRAALGAGPRVTIRWLPYDWSLNERK
jgi:hypothetical protein